MRISAEIRGEVRRSCGIPVGKFSYLIGLRIVRTERSEQLRSDRAASVSQSLKLRNKAISADEGPVSTFNHLHALSSRFSAE
jgi:hypothetical protein